MTRNYYKVVCAAWALGLALSFLTALGILAWIGVIPNVLVWILINLVFVASSVPAARDIVNDAIAGVARGSSMEHERLEGSFEGAKTLLCLGNPIGWVCVLMLFATGLVLIGIFLLAEWPPEDEEDEEWSDANLPREDISSPPPVA